MARRPRQPAKAATTATQEAAEPDLDTAHAASSPSEAETGDAAFNNFPITFSLTPEDDTRSPVREVRNPIKRGTSGTVTGGSCGGALACWAQTLQEPLKTGLSIAAPVISAFIASVWPGILASLKALAENLWVEWEQKRAIEAMEKYVQRQREMLKDDTLSEATRRVIERNIEQVHIAIVHKDFSIISNHMK